MILTHQCSCSSLDYELSDQSLRLFGVPSEFVTQQTSESRRRRGYKIHRREQVATRRGNVATREVRKINATNQITTDYSHEERLCDLTVIEGTARRHRIVKTSRPT